MQSRACAQSRCAMAIRALTSQASACQVRSAVVSVTQGGRRAITVTTLLDVPSDDVIRHHLARPEVAAPADANDGGMPMSGRKVRLIDVVDVNSPPKSSIVNGDGIGGVFGFSCAAGGGEVCRAIRPGVPSG